MTTLTTFNTKHIAEITHKAQQLLPMRTEDGDPLVLEMGLGIRLGDEIEAGVTIDLYCYLVRDDGTQYEYENNAMLVNLDATFDGYKWIVTEPEQ